jgi:hypothetical protein
MIIQPPSILAPWGRRVASNYFFYGAEEVINLGGGACTKARELQIALSIARWFDYSLP